MSILSSGLTQKILDYWFHGHFNQPTLQDAAKATLMKFWFSSNPEVDAAIKEQFEESLLNYIEIQNDMLGNCDSALALTILLDQFPRNIYRGQSKAFDYVDTALQIALTSIEKGYDQLVHPVARSFFYLPLMHSEDMSMQTMCVEKYQTMANEVPEDMKPMGQYQLKFAIEHFDIVKRFGRFPHRNKLLGRESTQEEIEFLAEGASDFGQK
mmetsp:Transcript_27616/g.27842  ORF Transcript_27616/g.27842 Transcript_27616/m.27842 type:complete len:211 (+) Transcript_27616:27-659(+)|eukprot:CAMPEP_0182426464 /NCGR_PEP_ID=MMETSP1167-20130531/12966_1 /TAXON_ID=2988 /ORGANISM="Mallomonas Sp, Strain CCMP3275" /LENGTH=210 /DNA_ID=CAMNT_0024607915 /DNA_START=27 /DNA_END=659 /DNA_ORIENTATION=-